MIVCHCTGKTDRQIRQAVDSGARSCEEIAQRCDAGTVCGGCVPLIECLAKGQTGLGSRRTVASTGR